MNILNHFVVNFFLFCLGLMSIELLLLSINLNFIYFSVFIDDLIGQVFSLFILTVAAAESAIGLAIMIVFFKIYGDISIYKINLLSL
jgi:NADH-quinone oxidoreductase subunit K